MKFIALEVESPNVTAVGVVVWRLVRNMKKSQMVYKGIFKKYIMRTAKWIKKDISNEFI